MQLELITSTSLYKFLRVSVPNARVSHESPNWNPHSMRDADGVYTRNQRSSFDACSTSAKLLVQKARPAKARLSGPPRSIFGRSIRTRTRLLGVNITTWRVYRKARCNIRESRTKSRAASASNLEESSCWRIKILRRRFNINDLEISLTERETFFLWNYREILECFYSLCIRPLYYNFR